MRLLTESRQHVHEPKPYTQAEPLKLRSDVALLVRLLVARDRRLSDRSFWPAYSRAKHEISRACGWGAPPERYDQQQYEFAMRLYLRGCGA